MPFSFKSQEPTHVHTGTEIICIKLIQFKIKIGFVIMVLFVWV